MSFTQCFLLSLVSLTIRAIIIWEALSWQFIEAEVGGGAGDESAIAFAEKLCRYVEKQVIKWEVTSNND
jgi:hypothetical protein